MKGEPTGRPAGRGIPTRRTAGPGGRRDGRLTLEGPRTCRGVPAGDYKPRAALEGTHFFSAKTDIPPKLTYFLVLLQLAKRLCPFKLYRNSVQGGMVDSKSYCTNAQTHRDQASQVTDVSPGSSRSDNVRHGTPAPDHPPFWLAPPGMK